jgi:hypothetical protein
MDAVEMLYLLVFELAYEPTAGYRQNRQSLSSRAARCGWRGDLCAVWSRSWGKRRITFAGQVATLALSYSGSRPIS